MAFEETDERRLAAARGLERLKCALGTAERETDLLSKSRAIDRALKLVRRFDPKNRRLEGILLVQFGQALSDAPMPKAAPVRVCRAIASIEEGVRRLSSPQLSAERAHAQIVLANVLFERARNGDDIERARRFYESALSRLTPARHGEEWAPAHLNLGHLYVQRAKGARDANLQHAVAAYERALKVYAVKRARGDWVVTRLAKAVALSEFVGPRRIANQDAAIRSVTATLRGCPRKSMPLEWARCQNLLGTLYYERAAGDRSQNIEAAIAALRRALEVRTRAFDADGWRSSTINLALAYSDRVKGRRKDNLERALKLVDAAAAASARGSFNWAKTQTQRAAILFDRLEGRRSRNLSRALSAGRAAMAALDLELAPREWASAVFVCANALSELAHLTGIGVSEEAIELLEAMRRRLNGAAFTGERATAALNLATAYMTRIKASRADNLERAILYSEEALKVFTQETAPADWALLQANLSGCYFERVKGKRRANLERALEAGLSALRIFTSAAPGAAWVGVKLNLANIYRDRLTGARSDNLALALDAVTDAMAALNAGSSPLDWAAAHQIRASVLLHSPTRARRRSIAQAMKSISIASAIYAKHGLGHEWARTRATLATLWINRPDGERADNIEHAIVASEEALSVLSLESDPLHWGQAQSDLAIGYFERSRGIRADNIEAGIAAIRRALKAYTPATAPYQWARAQGNLASFFIVRERGGARENTARAVRALRRSLLVFSRAENPFEWAQGTMNLALAVQRLDAPDGGLDRSIELLRAALAVLNARDHPLDWAMSKANLANALRWRAEAGDQSLVRLAIDAYRDALTVFTPTQFPNENIRTGRLLATAYADLGQWQAADRTFALVRRTAADLIGPGLNSAERERVLAEIARLGPDSAYVRWRMGDPAGAFERLEAGRAVELTLRAEFYDLASTPQERTRLRALLNTAERGELQLAGTRQSARSAQLKRLQRTQRALIRRTRTRTQTFSVTETLAALTEDGAIVIAPVVAQSGAVALRAFKRGGRVIIDGAPMEVAAPPLLTQARSAMGASVVLVAGGHADNRRAEAWRLYGETLPEPPAGARLLVLAPGEAPPPVLAIGPDGPLIERYETLLWPNLFIASRARRTQSTRFSFGAIVDPRGDLDGALVEHGFCAPLFSAHARRAVIGRKSRFDAALATLKDQSYWLIATHGRFDADRPRRSALSLAQGEVLTLSDMAQMSVRNPPRLIILSACESGVTERRHRPEEFQGFASVLLEKGAGAVVAANWPVDDMASAFTIGRFLENHLRDGQAPAQALQAAQVWLRRASLEDLESFLGSRLGAMRGLQRNAAHRMRDRLRARREHPFEDPVHWAAYSLWGA